MAETPKFVRFARSLAMGAMASAALLQCTPAAQQSTPLSEPSSGAAPQPAATDSAPTTDTATGTATATAAGAQPAANAGGVVRTGDRCQLVGAAQHRIEGRTLVYCGCAESAEPSGATTTIWQCSSRERSAGGLDGRACSQREEQRNDDGGSPGNLCVCVETAQRAEFACYQAFQIGVGPLAPPELAA